MKKHRFKTLLIVTLLILLGAWWLLRHPNDQISSSKEKHSAPAAIPKTMTLPPPKGVAATSTPGQIKITAQTECEQKLQKLEASHPLQKLRAQGEAELRMRNLHLQFEGEIYRLRQFYDDADEGERLTYLVYEEDEDEFASIIERTLYQKGERYQELERYYREGQAQKLFEEEAFTVHALYLHYRNGKLIHAAGTLDDSHLECTLQSE